MCFFFHAFLPLCVTDTCTNVLNEFLTDTVTIVCVWIFSKLFSRHRGLLLTRSSTNIRIIKKWFALKKRFHWIFGVIFFVLFFVLQKKWHSSQRLVSCSRVQTRKKKRCDLITHTVACGDDPERKRERCNSVKLMSLVFCFLKFTALQFRVSSTLGQLFGLCHMRHISLELISLGKIENSLWMPVCHLSLGLMEPKLSFLFSFTLM